MKQARRSHLLISRNSNPEKPELDHLLIDPEEEKKRAAELAGDACGIPRHRK